MYVLIITYVFSGFYSHHMNMNHMSQLQSWNLYSLGLDNSLNFLRKFLLLIPRVWGLVTLASIASYKIDNYNPWFRWIDLLRENENILNFEWWNTNMEETFQQMHTMWNFHCEIHITRFTLRDSHRAAHIPRFISRDFHSKVHTTNVGFSNEAIFDCMPSFCCNSFDKLFLIVRK